MCFVDDVQVQMLHVYNIDAIYSGLEMIKLIKPINDRSGSVYCHQTETLPIQKKHINKKICFLKLNYLHY
jgi:hypothetical protein